MVFGNRYTYSRWDGSQRVFDIDGEEVMDQLSQELTSHGDVQRALRELLNRGMQSREGQPIQGLRELLEQLRAMRQRRLEQYNLDSVAKDLKERLDKVVQTERQGIERRLGEARQQMEGAGEAQRAQQEGPMKLLEERAGRNKEKLDALPESLGGALRELQQYDFMDPEAQRQFQELMDMLRRQMMQNVVQDLKDRIQGMTPQQMAAMRQMLHDLNQMLREKMRGQEPDFQAFMQKWGPLFGPNPPQSLEELMGQLQQQMGQMQSLLESMSPEQRQELFEALSSGLDPEMARELAQLAMAMEQLYPVGDLRREYPFMGEEDITLEQAMDLMGHLQSMDELERQITEVTRRGKAEDVDLDLMQELLGEDARRQMEQLQDLARRLEEAGYVVRRGDKLELTPRAIRKIGQKALQELFAQLKKDRLGQHIVAKRGAGGELEGDTKAYEFGDPFEVHLQRTVMNGVTRQGPGTPVRLFLEDFEIYRREHMTDAATVLLLDQSRSMGMFGSFLAAKRVALALYSLIHSQFPRDGFYIIGFSDYAVELKGEELPGVTWNAWVSGTNMHHALMLSRKLLGKHKGATRQIIMVTDGEPTAHLEGGHAFFSYPPSYRTVEETLREVRRCGQEGITINTFMLDNSSYLLDFVDRMTKLNRGRALYTTPDKLGQYVLVDYLKNRRKRVAS